MNWLFQSNPPAVKVSFNRSALEKWEFGTSPSGWRYGIGGAVSGTGSHLDVSDDCRLENLWCCTCCGCPVQHAEQFTKAGASGLPASLGNSLTTSHQCPVVEQGVEVAEGPGCSEGPLRELLENEIDVAVEHQKAELTSDGPSWSPSLPAVRRRLPPSRRIHSHAETVEPDRSVASCCLAHENCGACTRTECDHKRAAECPAGQEFVLDFKKLSAPSVSPSPVSTPCGRPAQGTVLSEQPIPIKPRDKSFDIGRNPGKCSSIETPSETRESKGVDRSKRQQEKTPSCSKKRTRSQAHTERQGVDTTRPISSEIEPRSAPKGRPRSTHQTVGITDTTTTRAGKKVLTGEAMSLVLKALGERGIRRLNMGMKWDEALDC
ncbi:conserved hypothetical protein [Neospora caninum Liverpool]|uniref:Uncharacterized protein n=1 Tax=Neospora caninum (strain Liverpool) TaxID=572307 RepID=F0VDP2_NEOCL|nr:conserved hypothetical protein [Neospora caninum Liverpool]CBZ51835.1 conserved hypothetical protein [Neospora caninum Liverpool]|eukprot:XP_003881868.1 conserved hypothetical protein [Neospora caninum Liverpool]